MALQANSSLGYKTATKFLIGSMFGFYFLGYSPWLSVGLGLIAGLTSGFIAAWWNAQEDYITDQPAETEATPLTEIIVPAQKSRDYPPVRYGFGIKTARSPRQGIQGFGWPFRGRRRR